VSISKAVPNFTTKPTSAAWWMSLNRAFYGHYSLPVPVVGAINGHAIRRRVHAGRCAATGVSR